MASILYIAEFTTTASRYGMTIGAARTPPIAEQTVTVGAGSVQSNPFNPATVMVRVSNDTGGPCTLKFGTNPTASTTSGIRHSAGQSEYYIVDNSSSRVAAISVTA